MPRATVSKKKTTRRTGPPTPPDPLAADSRDKPVDVFDDDDDDDDAGEPRNLEDDLGDDLALEESIPDNQSAIEALNAGFAAAGRAAKGNLRPGPFRALLIRRLREWRRLSIEDLNQGSMPTRKER